MPSKLSVYERLARAHDEWRLKKCLNLIPSENIMSEPVRQILSSDMASRYCLPINAEVHGVFVENGYRGTGYTEEVLAKVNALAGETFMAKHALLEPLSGHIAAMLMLVSTCKKGDLILCPDANDGGYDGYCQPYLPDILGLRAKYLPYDRKEGTVDAERAAEMIRRESPALVVLGSSYIPFQYPVRECADACEDVGATLGYDGAHILGIVPAFQQPLREGADLMVGNTHKTFWGPQGGVALTNDEELRDQMFKDLYWRVLDNTHLNRLAATGHALLEWKKHGRKYAAQVVKNSKALGKQLDSLGYPLRYARKGFTASHQLCIETAKISRFAGTDMNSAAKRLESQNVITDAVGRLGTQEITRMGLMEKDMGELAGIIADGAKGEKVAARVAELRKRMRLGYIL